MTRPSKVSPYAASLEEALAKDGERIRELEADVERLKAERAKHEEWCEFRKRLDLSFALGELSGAIQDGGGRESGSSDGRAQTMCGCPDNHPYFHRKAGGGESGHCDRPDRDVTSTKCGYPLPCPWHTAILDGPVLSAPETVSDKAFGHLKEVAAANPAARRRDDDPAEGKEERDCG